MTEKKTTKTPQDLNAYHVQYKREKLKEVRVYIPKGSELENWISNQGNASRYIRDLIENDMRRNK